jgi:hypothetical protein
MVTVIETYQEHLRLTGNRAGPEEGLQVDPARFSEIEH